MRSLIFILGLVCCLSGFSQANTKNDIIMTSGGDLLQVTVTKVTENTISFNYPGESVVNEISTNGVEKIVFASGRTQNFSGKATGNVTTGEQSAEMPNSDTTDVYVPPSYEKNSISIIPLDFKRNGTYDKTLSSKATEYVVNLLSAKATKTGIQVLPMGEAVEKLVDAGVNYAMLRESSPEELRTVLGTEYLLYISISENESTRAVTSNTADQGTPDSIQIERLISITLFDPASEEAYYKLDFSEDSFLKKGVTTDVTLLANGRWKSSLRYLSDQFFVSNTFSTQ